MLCGLLLEVSVKLFLRVEARSVFHVEQDDKLLVDGSRFQLCQHGNVHHHVFLDGFAYFFVLFGSKEALQRGVFGHHHLLLHALHEGGSRHFAHHNFPVDLGGFAHGLRHGGNAVLYTEWREVISTENIGWFL